MIHLAPEPVDEDAAPVQEPSSDVPAAANGALGIDIPGFSTLSASVTIEREREPAPAAQPTTKRNAAWAERVRAEDAGPAEPFAMDDSPDPLLELPNLTPQAARAIAAAAQAHTDAERDAALAWRRAPTTSRSTAICFCASCRP